MISLVTRDSVLCGSVVLDILGFSTHFQEAAETGSRISDLGIGPSRMFFFWSEILLFVLWFLCLNEELNAEKDPRST